MNRLEAMIADQESVIEQSATLAAEYEADAANADEDTRIRLIAIVKALRQDEAIARSEVERLKQMRTAHAVS